MSRAEQATKPNCRDVIEAADKALDAKQREIDTCRQGLLIYSEQNKALVEDNAAKSRALESWYRNPFIVFGLGIIAGGAATIYLSK